MENTKKCSGCYYSRPAVNEELSFCSYVADVMALDGIAAGYDMKLAKDLVKTIAFSGDVFEAYVDTGKEYPVLAPCVNDNGLCRKYKDG